MVNIIVRSETFIEVENNKIYIQTVQDMVAAVKAILDKAFYSGETICLEQHSPTTGFIEIERWK